MDCLALLQSRTKSPMKTIFQVQFSSPADDMAEQITIKGGVFFQQRVQVKCLFGGDQLIKSDLCWRQRRPLLLGIAMGRIRPVLADSFEDHTNILPMSYPDLASRVRSR